MVHSSYLLFSLTHLHEYSLRDKRIVELGGAEVGRKKQYYDIEGKELPGQPGYKYYGAAKDLPGTYSLLTHSLLTHYLLTYFRTYSLAYQGVRELFADAEEEITKLRNKRSRTDIYKNITPDYYGYLFTHSLTYLLTYFRTYSCIGYRDDDDNILVPREMAMEKKLIEKSIKEWRKSNTNADDNGSLFNYSLTHSLTHSLLRYA